MRITHILEASGGGAGRQVRLLATAQKAMGHEVSLLVSPLRGDPDFREQLLEVQSNGVATVEVPMARNPSIVDLTTAKLIRKHLRANESSVVHTHCAKAGLVGRLAAGPLRREGLKVFHTPHSWYLHGLAGAGRGLGLQLERWLAGKTDGFVCVSEDEVTDGQGWGIIKNGDAHLAVNGLPGNFAEAALSKQDARKHLNLPQDAACVGLFSRLDRRKGIAALLDAFAALPGAPRLVLVGTGTESQSLVERARGLGIEERVHFIGYHADAGRCVRALDVAVLPSAWEGRSLFALEALAGGVRLIAADAPGNRFVEAYGGVIVKNTRAAVLSTSISAELGKPAPPPVTLPSIAEQADRLIGIYQGN